MTKIASWNVNSLKVRMPRLIEWLKDAAPDVVLLQEIKTVADSSPFLELTAAGYRAQIVGQKSYNGVAILSRDELTAVRTTLPGGDTDDQARYIEARIGDLTVASIYLPNGNPVDTEKFTYKLEWMERLYRHAAELLKEDRPLILGGDYNVCPTDDDVYDPAGWKDDALCRKESRAAFRKLVYLGFTDAYRARHPDTRAYTFWDYQNNAWPQNRGLRIDHLLLSPQAADRLDDSGIDTAPRGKDKASDHTPVWCTLR
ncbi:MAG: exodeoxyribonuclease III [Rhodospirillaceae bacterium]|nr:exodeoxyribonuclease III [Rhodospirillaceae bacterium]